MLSSARWCLQEFKKIDSRHIVHPHRLSTSHTDLFVFKQYRLKPPAKRRCLWWLAARTLRAEKQFYLLALDSILHSSENV